MTDWKRPSLELARRRRNRGMAQQALRRQHEQRQRIAAQQRGLPAQQVEVLRGGRAVDEAQVDVRRRLEECVRAGRSSAPAPGPRSRAAAGSTSDGCSPHLARPEVTN